MALTFAAALPLAAVAAGQDAPGGATGRVPDENAPMILVLLAAGSALWGLAELAARFGTGRVSGLTLASLVAGGAFVGLGVLVFMLDPYAGSLTVATQAASVFSVVLRP